MRQGTGHPAEQLKVFLTGLVNPCTMDFVSAKGSTLGVVIYCHLGCMNYFILAKIGNVNMKKTFQKTLVAASVGAVLAMGSMAAQAADNLLFPYITTKTGAYTFISISNNGNLSGSNPYHVYYMTKPIGSTAATACNHFDSIATTTANDVMQYEVMKKIDMKTAFADTTSTPVYLPATQTNVEGFMIVAADVTAASLYHGEATIVDASTGTYYTYSSSNLTATAASDPNYATLTDAANGVNKAAVWYPSSVVTTQYYILPTGLRSTMAAVAGGGLTTTLTAATAGIVGGGAFDLNENPFSGTQSPSVTCFGYVKPDALLQPATAAAVANGGWLNTSKSGGTSDGYLQFKVQSSTALGSVFTTISRDTAN
jgi:hypothetical protein